MGLQLQPELIGIVKHVDMQRGFGIIECRGVGSFVFYQDSASVFYEHDGNPVRAGERKPARGDAVAFWPLRGSRNGETEATYILFLHPVNQQTPPI